MGNIARKIMESKASEVKGRTVVQKIKNTYTDELILGICTHIGSKRDIVVEKLREILKNSYEYEVEVIKLSDFITQHSEIEYKEVSGKTNGYSLLKNKIEGGDALREKYKSNSLLAELAIRKIRIDREEAAKKGIEGQERFTPDSIEDEEMTSRRICYIIDSLKNKEEVEVLRAVYRDIFYLFSVYTPSVERINYLINKKDGLSREEAESIIETDEYEDIGSHGQNVRDTFIEADFFIRSSNTNADRLENNIRRYFHLIFNSEIVTPVPEETAMYFAKSSAGNSACLSRQVGATITDSNGVPIAQGWNDVPKFGGNLYNDADPDSQKCHKRRVCMNVTHRNEIIEEILVEIKQKITPDIGNNKVVTLVNNKECTEKEEDNSALIQSIEEIIRKSKFKSIIEYSRSIHAEMHAIVIGSQMTGSRMVGGSLYCTTYPCHNCARHIVLAGIQNIYYIEPYKKSLCLTLHDDSLTEDETDTTRVRILPYEGVAPRRYLDFFAMVDDDRKGTDGKVKIRTLNEAVPKKRISLQSLPTLESQAVHALEEYGL